MDGNNASMRANVVGGAIIAALLVTVLAPAVGRARHAADRTGCDDNLRKLAASAHKYESTHGFLPKSEYHSFFGDAVTGGWSVRLLPHLGEKETYELYRHDLGPGKPENQKAVSRRVRAFECPASPATHLISSGAWGREAGTAAVCDYVVAGASWGPKPSTDVFGVGALFGRTNDFSHNVQPSYSIITDGLANTILFAEQAGHPEWWVKGKKKADRNPVKSEYNGAWGSHRCPFPVATYSADGLKKSRSTDTPGECRINCNNSEGLYGFHDGGANSVMVDGSVRFLKEGIDPYVLSALVSRSLGEAISSTDY